MPPLNSQNPVNPSPNPEYDFIMNAGAQVPKKGFSGPKMPKNKLIQLAIAGFGLLMLLSLVVVTISSLKGNPNQSYVDVLSRSQEIIRVNGLAGEKIDDSDTLALLTTTSVALASDQAEFNAYLATANAVIDPSLLGGYLNSETDAALALAAKNNNLSQTYSTYLKGSLNGYLDSLKKIQATASAKAKPIIAGAIASTETLLTAPQFK